MISYFNIPAKCVVLALLCVFAGCKKDKVAKELSIETLNVAYGGNVMQKMDIYLPAGVDDKTPVVILLHGGGFIAGSKEDFTAISKFFRDENFIVANLSYRLVNSTGLIEQPPKHLVSEVKISDQLEDIDQAIDKLTSFLSGQDLHPSKYYMAGHSAGAILTLLYTQGDYNNDQKIRAGGNWAGNTDLSIPADSLFDDLDPRFKELMYRATGFEYKAANNLAFMAVSAYWQAFNHEGNPTISIYPEHNIVFNMPDEAEFGLYNHQNFHQLLKSRGVPEKLDVYKGEDHGFGTYPESWHKLIKETAEFFREN